MTDIEKVRAILEEGYAERLYQAKKWANGEIAKLDKIDDDKIDRPDSWCMWMDRYKGTWNGYSFPFQYNDDTLRNFRKAMIKVMMLAVAAILWVDRRLSKHKS